MCNIACSPVPAALDCLLAPPCCLAGLFSSGLDHAVPTGAGSLWSLQGQLPMRPGTHFWLRISLVSTGAAPYAPWDPCLAQNLQGQLPMRPVFHSWEPETKQDQKSET